jgi:filamentous hemagglutinin family protein
MQSAWALPDTPNVVSGQAQIVLKSPTEMHVVQSTPQVVIEWNSFNIGIDEVVRFVQGDSFAQALNRITGGGASEILGQLFSNGHVVLSNAAGINFGPSAKVDVGSIIATAANIPTADFTAGKLSFSQSGQATAGIVNEGTITVAEGGIAALVAPWVRNAGTINVRLGKIALSSAETFTVDLYGDRLIQFAVDKAIMADTTGRGDAARVENLGRLASEGGSIQITAAQAKNVLANAINMSGVATAQSVQQVNGEIVLQGSGADVVQVAGTLNATGLESASTGGSISILGKKIAVLGEAKINASGDQGGGQILIGGNLQGKGPEPNADRTFVGQGAEIVADAATAGDGGKIIVWADDTTYFAGMASAQGGATAGNGGFIEISGKRNLAFESSRVELAAANGTTGTLLLDPQDILIQGGSADGTADTDALTNSFGGASAGQVLAGEFSGAVTIRESEIEGLNANIVLEAGNSIRASGTFSSSRLDVVSGRNLTISTRNDPGDETGSAQAAGIALTGIATIRTQGGGSITMATGTGANSASGSAANIATAALTAVGGAVSLSAGNGGTVTTGAIASTGGAGMDGGTVNIVSAVAVTTGAITSSGGAAAVGTNGRNAGDVIVSGGTVQAGAITASGTVGNGTDRDGGDAGAITLTASGGTPLVTLAGNLAALGGAATGTGTGGTGGAISLNGPTVITANQTVSAIGGSGAQGGDITVAGTLDSSTATVRTLAISAGSGDISLNGTVGPTNRLSTLTVTGNDIVLGDIGTSGQAGVTGATAVTASTSGADGGSITFGGTVYNANAQTYAGVVGESLLINGGSATSFLSSADAIAFNTGTLRLSDGANLEVNSAGGAITLAGGIRGHSTETVNLTSGAGAGDISVGAIGSGDEIASVAITSGTGTTTLTGNIVTADIAGNNVTITGPVTLGANVAIDAVAANHSGTVTITGATTGAGRAFTVDAAAISTGAITTTGGAGVAGGAVSLTSGGTLATGALTASGGSGAVGGAVMLTAGGTASTGALTASGGANANAGSITLSAGGSAAVGAVTASGGTAGAGTAGRSGGTVELSAADLNVAGATASGSAGNGAGQAGGAGGSITLAATDGTPVVTLGGNFTAAGGNAGAGGVAGAGGTIAVTGPAILNGNRIISTAGGTGGLGGSQTYSSSIDGDGVVARTLTLTGGTGGDVSVGGAIGATTALSTLTVTGNDIVLGDIGTSGQAGVTGATAVTASTSGADDGSITTGLVNTAGAQTWGGTGLAMTIGGDLVAANAAITVNTALTLSGDSLIEAGSGVLTLGSTVAAGAHELIVSGNEINIAGGISGTGALTLRQGTLGAGIELGASATDTANELDLRESELSLIQAGFSSVTFGRSDSTAGATISALTSAALANDLNLLSPNGVTLAGNLTTSGRAITLQGPLTLTGDRIIASGGGDITVAGNVIGNAAGRALTLTAGSGDISLSGAMGSSGVRLGAVGLDGDTVSLGGDLYAASLSIGATSGATLAGIVNATGTVSATGTTSDVAFLQNVTAATGSFLNTGELQFGDSSADSASFGSGGLAHTAGSTTLFGALTSGSSGINLADVTLGSDLTVNAGTGPLSVGAMSAASHDLTVQGSGAATIASIGNAGAINADKTGGGLTISGTVTAESLVTSIGNFVLSLLGSTTLSGAFTASNAGNLTIGNDAGDTFSIGGGIDASAVGGTTTLAGTITTSGQAASFGATTLADAVSISTNGGAISFDGSVTGSAAGRDVTLDAASGTIAVGGVMGTSGTRLGAVSLNGSDISVSGAVFGGSLAVSSASEAVFEGQADVTGAASVQSSVATARFENGLTAGSASFLNTGTLQLGDTAGDVTTVASGGITHTAGPTTIAGTIAASSGSITFGETALAAITTFAPATSLGLGAVAGNGHDLTVQGGGTATAASFSNLDVLSLQKSGGSFTVNGALGASSISSASGAFDVALHGDTTVSGAATFANAGYLTLGDSAADTFIFSGGLNATAVTGATTIAGSLSTSNQPISIPTLALAGNSQISAGTSSVSLGTVAASSRDLTVTADSIGLNGAWSGTGNWTIQPASTARSIGLAGGAGDFALDAAELANLFAGSPASLTIGRSVSTGALTSNAFTATGPLTLRAGPMSLAGALGMASGSLALVSSGSVTGILNLGAGTGLLKLSAQDADLIGTVDGQSGALAAGRVWPVVPLGVGPFLINGFAASSQPPAVAPPPQNTDVIQAVVNNQLVLPSAQFAIAQSGITNISPVGISLSTLSSSQPAAGGEAPTPTSAPSGNGQQTGQPSATDNQSEEDDRKEDE